MSIYRYSYGFISFSYCLPDKKKGIEYFARIFLISDKVCMPDRLLVSLHYNF